MKRSFVIVLFSSDISLTLLSTSSVTVILFSPLSVIGLIRMSRSKESAYLGAAINLSYTLLTLLSGNVLLTVTLIESLMAFPILSMLTFTLNELSATETIDGLILIIWSSIT